MCRFTVLRYQQSPGTQAFLQIIQILVALPVHFAEKIFHYNINTPSFFIHLIMRISKRFVNALLRGYHRVAQPGRNSLPFRTPDQAPS